MKVVISGYGRMGHMIEKVLLERGIELAEATEDVCATDPALAAQCVCIDFTFPESFRNNYKFLADHFKAVVVGTTGWNDIKDEVIGYFSLKGTPMIYASNYSIGVNALFAAVQKAASIMRDQGYEPKIQEIHHIHKMDAPSGTAKSLGNIVAGAMGQEPPIESIREGEVPGTHIVEFGSSVDKLVFSHEAFSREGFARGAVYAAQLTETITGVHEFKDLII